MGTNQVVTRAAKIGGAARATGLSIDTIRFYERAGLLKRAARTEGGFRLFGPEELQALRFIRKSQELGFSLDEIRELLILRSEDVPSCPHVKELLEHKLSSVEQKIRELRTLEQSLKVALRKCNSAVKTHPRAHENCCPVLQEISRVTKEQPEANHENRSSVFRRMPQSQAGR